MFTFLILISGKNYMNMKNEDFFFSIFKHSLRAAGFTYCVMIKQQLHLSRTNLPKISYSQSSVSSKLTDYLLVTVICQQQMFRIFAIERRLSPANLPNICYWQTSVTSNFTEYLLLTDVCQQPLRFVNILALHQITVHLIFPRLNLNYGSLRRTEIF